MSAQIVFLTEQMKGIPMKAIFVFALLYGLLQAQDVKPAPQNLPAIPSAIASPSEREFTPEEIEKLTLYNAQIEVLRARYKMDDVESQTKKFNEEAGAIAIKQEVIVKAACIKVGVPEQRIRTGGCGVSLGVDATGKPVNGQDGKQIPSKVWFVPEKKFDLPAVDKK